MQLSDYKPNRLPTFITGILLGSTSQIAQADIESGKAWLYNNSNSSSYIVNDLQTKQEATLTLSILQASLPNNNIDFSTELHHESSSEGLVRLLLLAHQQGKILQTAWQKLIYNQNQDGGFAHIQGWQSNPLDTAFVLIALHETGYLDSLDPTSQQQWQTRIGNALAYIASQQQTNGSYKISHLDELYTSSYVLSALTPYLNQYGQYIINAQALVTYLESKQTGAGTWSTQPMQKGLFLDALVADSLYPYQSSGDSTTFSSAFIGRVLALQSADGSWQNDAYVTALVLKTIQKLSYPAINPTMSSLSLTVTDSETNSLLSNVNVILTSENKTINAMTDNMGQLSISDIPVGSYTISLNKTGYTSINLSTKLALSVQNNLGVIKLSRSSESNTSFIQGIVTKQADNTSISGAIVKVYFNNQVINTVTNEQGHYQISIPYTGQFAIDVLYDGYETSAGSGVLNFGKTYNFSPKLHKPNYHSTVLFGKVIDEEGHPLSGVKIFINGDHLATSTSDGSYRIENYQVDKDRWTDYLESIKPSDFQLKNRLVLHAQYEGYDSIHREFTLEEEQENDLSTTIMYALDPNNPKAKPAGMIPGTINFKFIDKDSKQPVHGVKLHFHKINSQGEVFFKGSLYSYLATNKAKFTNGPWQFFISKRNYKNSQPIFINLKANTEQDLTLEIDKLGAGTLNVNVFNKSDNQPIYNAKILAERLDDDNQIIDTVHLGFGSEHANGEFELLEGKWRIQILHDAYQETDAQIIQINKGETYKLNVALSYPPYKLTTNIVDSISNQSITNAHIIVYEGESDTLLYDTHTNSDGIIELNNVTASNLRLEITAKGYLGNTYYIDKQFLPKGNVNLGEIRLRPKSAEIVLPDLMVNQLDTSALTTEQQSLITTGILHASISNIGNTEVKGDVKITAFIDNNHNRQLDKGEQIVGSTTLADTLAINGVAQVGIKISGKVDFRDAPIAVMVDSNAQVVEKEEGNNVRLTSDGVEIKPKQGTLEAQIAWHYPLSSDSGSIAAPLQDTNGDGVIGQGDVSSILIYKGGRYHVLDGRTGQKQFDIAGAGSQELAAIGDVDSDGLPDIVVTASDGIRVYSNTGELKKTLPAHLSFSGWSDSAYHPIIADLDQDGIPEIIQNNKIFTYTDGLIVDNLSSGQSQGVADLDGDGYLDIIGLSGVADHQGRLRYHYTNQQGHNIGLKFTAVGDVLNAGQPQIVAVYGSHTLIIDAQTGEILRQYGMPSSGGGSPVIADFDGDGIADFGVAQAYQYVAMRGDGSVIWSTPISDSSAGTGSTVFDFDNDGKMEAVHFDERYLRIYDAATGVERIKIPNSTATAHEYPIVGDFDADGHADIVITSGHGNDIRMISSKNKDWANTRNIWNQYSYHVTNINDDLSVPKNEPNSWEVHNTYRANLLLGQNATAAADLTTSYLQIKDNGIHSPSTFTARIGNAGGKPVKAGTPISFYRRMDGQDDSQATLIGTVTLNQTLAGGDYQDISLDYNPLLQSGQTGLANFGELIVVANDAGAGVDSATGIVAGTDNNTAVIQEYTRRNNIARLALTRGFNAHSLSAHLDKTHYTANETVTITSVPTNLGSFPTQPDVRVSILDNAGHIVEQFADTSVDLGVSLLAGSQPNINSTTVTNTWNTAQNRIGNYTARIELMYQDKRVASVDRPFAIVADGVVHAQTNSQISTDKTTYLASDLVELHSRIINTASNAMASQRNISIDVKDPAGQLIWSQNYSYDELAPNAIKDQYFTLPLKTAQAGNYTVIQSTTSIDGSQSEQLRTVTFKVLTAAESGVGISGTIASPAKANIGDTIHWHWSIHNDNNTILKNIPLSIVLYKNDSQDVLATLPLKNITLNANGTIAGELPWNTNTIDSQDGDQITALLVAEFNGNSKGLATTQVVLSEPPISVDINGPNQLADSLLVYYSCAEGWHTYVQNFSFGVFEHGCFTQRATLLKHYLDRIQIPYKLVKRPEHFAHEMQSGKYGQYWLLGSIEQLRPHTKKELTELVFSGDNIIMDSGLNSWQNQDLYLLAGVKHKGRILPKDANLTVDTNKLTPSFDPIIANTPLKADGRRQMGSPYHSMWVQWLEPTNANKTQIWATINGQRKRLTNIAQRREAYKDYPAIITQHYGNGMPVALSFDLVGSLYWATHANLPPYQNNANVQELHWDNTLKQLLKDKRQVAKIDHVPQEVVRIPIHLNNQGHTNKRIQIDIDLPKGSQWLGYQGGTDDTLAGDDTVHYQITLQANQRLNDIITLRLPKTTGTHPVRLTVSDTTQGSTKAKLLKQYETRYLVRDIASRIQLLQQHIQPWSVFGTDGYLALNAKTQINLIESHYQHGARQLAVYEAARLGNTLSSMQSLANRDIQAIRLEADELLRALQIDWYIERDGYIPPP